ncbi:transcriptional regulator, partial [Myroides odoratimimus]|nr:transcriptional regulator [Myroides odoratimimus]
MAVTNNDKVPKETILALRDAIELLSGKWKF